MVNKSLVKRIEYCRINNCLLYTHTTWHYFSYDEIKEWGKRKSSTLWSDLEELANRLNRKKCYTWFTKTLYYNFITDDLDDLIVNEDNFEFLEFTYCYENVKNPTLKELVDNLPATQLFEYLRDNGCI